ncbi:MAG: hypothetical protein DWQ04_27170 [Chloroflexi bacterium]|nr:MAG: hypothetical protein DWQ04_27170 [Chloroflexota bacterium]
MTKEDVIAQARELRQNDKFEESQELLLGLLEEHSDDPVVLFEVGGAYDVLDEPREAIPYYRKAIDAGLEDSDLHECLVCLGACQRMIGKFENAIETLEEAIEQFPDNNSSKVFLALTYYNDGQEDEAMKLLLNVLLTTTKDEDILEYADTLDYYKDNLDDIWDE